MGGGERGVVKIPEELTKEEVAKLEIEAFVERMNKIREDKKEMIEKQSPSEEQKEIRQHLIRLLSSDFSEHTDIQVKISYSG
ncbi:hypothetical protein CACET_c32140 [Clostridium aceticum]|uniref:Uncharacterized protein n=1 Tax=Clostridium aceticum TaxID=84022 RepID=A0A0D8I773_9CLOT|nr:hypothetical protein [Clostridium aceticum]AKL96658.1 hypothetical protein CACET_c32140 [Clostridium aceticum]KJF25904.1 hypothetical protein TZ02_16090 [Clostridium aceticum]